jgi:hypothetical protein
VRFFGSGLCCVLGAKRGSGFLMSRSFDGAVRISLAALLMSGGWVWAQTTTAAEQDKVVRINQIQVIGSHNSYHAGFAPSERKYMEAKNPEGLRGLDYHHAPLADQLSGGVRQ